MSLTEQTIRPRRRKRQQPLSFAHGWTRRSDARGKVSLPPAGHHRRAPAGTSLLLMLIVAVLAGIGIVRVHASTRVLEMGAEITTLTEEQAELLDLKRRLSAERAYLRHPDQIGRYARDHLGMVPMTPELMQEIRLKDVPPPPPEPIVLTATADDNEVTP